MILRLWRGWTEGTGTAEYERLLRGEVAPGIVDRRLDGFRGMSVLRRDAVEEEAGTAEFLTAMVFEDATAVAAFTGGDPRGSVVPPAARRVLSRFDAHSAHYVELERFG